MNVDSAPEASPAPKTLSVMRYDRVQAILDGEPALKDLLGPKDQEVIKRNKEKHYYSRGVILVTTALHERGFDAHNADRNSVLCLAFDLLRDKPPKPVVQNSKPPPKPKLEPKTNSEPKIEPKTEPKTEPKSKESKPVRRAAAPKKQTPKPKVAASKEPVATPPAPVAATAAPAPSVTTPPVPGKDQKPGFVYYVYGTALSLAVSIHKTLEIGDRMPGAESRLDAASKLVDLLKPMSNVGVPMPEDFDGAFKHDKISGSKG